MKYHFVICLSQKRGTVNPLSVSVIKCVVLVLTVIRKNFVWAVAH